MSTTKQNKKESSYYGGMSTPYGEVFFTPSGPVLVSSTSSQTSSNTTSSTSTESSEDYYVVRMSTPYGEVTYTIPKSKLEGSQSTTTTTSTSISSKSTTSSTSTQSYKTTNNTTTTTKTTTTSTTNKSSSSTSSSTSSNKTTSTSYTPSTYYTPIPKEPLYTPKPQEQLYTPIPEETTLSIEPEKETSSTTQTTTSDDKKIVVIEPLKPVVGGVKVVNYDPGPAPEKPVKTMTTEEAYQELVQAEKEIKEAYKNLVDLLQQGKTEEARQLYETEIAPKLARYENIIENWSNIVKKEESPQLKEALEKEKEFIAYLKNLGSAFNIVHSIQTGISKLNEQFSKLQKYLETPEIEPEEKALIEEIEKSISDITKQIYEAKSHPILSKEKELYYSLANLESELRTRYGQLKKYKEKIPYIEKLQELIQRERELAETINKQIEEYESSLGKKGIGSLKHILKGVESNLEQYRQVLIETEETMSKLGLDTKEIDKQIAEVQKNLENVRKNIEIFSEYQGEVTSYIVGYVEPEDVVTGFLFGYAVGKLAGKVISAIASHIKTYTITKGVVTETSKIGTAITKAITTHTDDIAMTMTKLGKTTLAGELKLGKETYTLVGKVIGQTDDVTQLAFKAISDKKTHSFVLDIKQQLERFAFKGVVDSAKTVHGLGIITEIGKTKIVKEVAVDPLAKTTQTLITTSTITKPITISEIPASAIAAAIQHAETVQKIKSISEITTTALATATRAFAQTESISESNVEKIENISKITPISIRIRTTQFKNLEKLSTITSTINLVPTESRFEKISPEKSEDVTKIERTPIIKPPKPSITPKPIPPVTIPKLEPITQTIERTLEIPKLKEIKVQIQRTTPKPPLLPPIPNITPPKPPKPIIPPLPSKPSTMKLSFNFRPTFYRRLRTQKVWEVVPEIPKLLRGIRVKHPGQVKKFTIAGVELRL